MICPKCREDCDRDEVDVGVGVIYGPWGCYACGWSEYADYDRSNGPSPAQLAHPDHYVDSQGGLTPLAPIAAKLDHFGLPGDELVNEAFRNWRPSDELLSNWVPNAESQGTDDAGTDGR